MAICVGAGLVFPAIKPTAQVVCLQMKQELAGQSERIRVIEKLLCLKSSKSRQSAKSSFQTE
jgi:hypothetical protein